jgi:hypothetical protein
LSSEGPKSLPKVEHLARLVRSHEPEEQLRLREPLRGDGDYYDSIAAAYFRNPFLRLTEEEVAVLAQRLPPRLGELVTSREAAARSSAPKVAVLCMPKSGSSFVQTALQHALDVPYFAVTSFGHPRMSSFFGMNSREQELDELALAKAVLCAPNGFVTQVHTRYSQYLALQLRAYGVTPIVTVRNVLDCIVSFDDMMMRWRSGPGPDPWISDTQFTLPLDYPKLEPGRRYDILARSFGVWLVGFYLSWKRCERQGLIRPTVVRYEDAILQRERFVEVVAGAVPLSEAQQRRLVDYAAQPDRERSRLNVGRRGRGREQVPADIRDRLVEYAGWFSDELSPEDIAYLFD